MTAAMEGNLNGENYDEVVGILPYIGQTYGSCDSEIGASVDLHGAVHQSPMPSFCTCLKVCVESTVFCGVFVGLFGSFLWWLELNVRTYCLTDWRKIPGSIHNIHLIVDIIKAIVIQFWTFSCIAPLCGWSTIKKLNLVYICIVGALLDAVTRLLLYTFLEYSTRLKSYIGNAIFLVTSSAVCYRFVRHCIAARHVRCNVFLLTLKLNLQFIFGLLLSIPFILVVLDLYYNASSIEKTILACALIIVFALPKLFINQVITNIPGMCLPGDEITLAICYLTGTTVIFRLMQARVEKLSYFILISVVHGLLNVIDKLSLPLKRKIFYCMRNSCKQRGNQQLSSVNEAPFLSNQTLISIITDTTSLIFSSAVAYLIIYYYKREENTGERYNGLMLSQEIILWCSIAVGIELIFNVIAVKIQAHLYKIPVITVWKRKWKSIIFIHMIQVMFIVLYFSEYLNNILLRQYYAKANITCFGFFDRV